MILHPSFVLPVMPCETPVGYASRVAFGLGSSLRAFCSRTDIPLQKLFEGESCTIDLLRAVCQLPQDTFADTTFIATPGRRLMLAGQTLSIDQVNREALRVCPACVREQLSDGRGFHETWAPREWSITPLHVCNIHSVPILSITHDSARRHRQDFAGRLREASSLGLLSPEVTEPVPESGLGQHIRDRLSGIDGDHWLSRFPLYASIKTAYMIGSAAMHGVRQAWVDLSPAERFEAGKLGHDILNEGEAGLRELFTEFQRSSIAEASTSGLLKTFGRIYVSMSQGDDSAFEPLADVLRRHIIETMPFGPGDVVLGQKVTERRLHSARTVTPDLGLSVVTALKRLRLIGVLDVASEEPVVGQGTFDAVVHADNIRRLAGALQRADAGRYLGLKRVYEDVAPILDMVGSMNVDKTRLIDQVFAMEDLDAFLASILGKAMPGSMAGFEPIAKASKRARTSIAKILNMILQGEITDVRISSSHRGIMSAMVRKDDILHAAIARRPWITLTAGAKVIGMKNSVLTALVRNKIIPAEGVSPVMLKPEDLETFTQTYVSRWEVSRQYRSMRGPDNRFSVTKAIAMAGLEPAFDEAKTVFRFYRRDAVLAAFGSPPV